MDGNDRKFSFWRGMMMCNRVKHDRPNLLKIGVLNFACT